MDFFKAEVDESAAQATHVQTINLGYTGETYNQMPVMVEFKAVPATLNEEQKLQLFNINPVQFTPQGQIQYVTPKYISSCAQTQTQDLLQDGIESQTDETPSLKREKPCPCHICGKRYANPKALKKHQVVHPEMVFEWQCRICNKTFPYKITMSRHVKLHAGEKLFKCENCKKRFETRYALVQHVKLHRSDVPFRCDLCDKPFLKSAEFSRHVRTHTGEKPFPCSVCDKAFTTKASFIKHSEKKHNLILVEENGVFKQECSTDANQIQTISLGYTGETYHQFPVMVELKAMPSTLSEDQKVQLFNINAVQFAPTPQIQYVPQKVMPSSCIQTQTIQTVQFEGKPYQPTNTHRTVDTQTVTEKPHACEICGKRFKNPQSLARHHTSHPEIPKTFTCHHCDKKFANPQALRRHQSKHPDIVYEWKCRFCPQSFPYKTTLSKHVKVHAGEKLFKCETCLKRFGNRYSLQRHVKIHTGEVPYKCEVCEKGFLKASDFGRHVRTHTGERPFECPECFKCFTQKSCLVKHAEKSITSTIFKKELIKNMFFNFENGLIKVT